MFVRSRAQRMAAKLAGFRALFAPSDGELSPMAIEVLADLRAFCGADKPSVRVSPQSGMIDTHAMAMAEGRREVWLRIVEYLGPSADRYVEQLRRAEARERDPLD